MSCTATLVQCVLLDMYRYHEQMKTISLSFCNALAPLLQPSFNFYHPCTVFANVAT